MWEGESAPTHLCRGPSSPMRWWDSHRRSTARRTFSRLLPKVQGQCPEEGARRPGGAQQGHGGPSAATAPRTRLLTGRAPGAPLGRDQLHQPFSLEMESVPRQRGQRWCSLSVPRAPQIPNIKMCLETLLLLSIPLRLEQCFPLSSLFPPSGADERDNLSGPSPALLPMARGLTDPPQNNPLNI